MGHGLRVLLHDEFTQQTSNFLVSGGGNSFGECSVPIFYLQLRLTRILHLFSLHQGGRHQGEHLLLHPHPNRHRHCLPIIDGDLLQRETQISS